MPDETGFVAQAVSDYARLPLFAAYVDRIIGGLCEKELLPYGVELEVAFSARFGNPDGPSLAQRLLATWGRRQHINSFWEQVEADPRRY